MMIIAIVPLVVAVIGTLAYALATNAKVQEMGRIAFFCGLLALMLLMSASHVRIGG